MADWGAILAEHGLTGSYQVHVRAVHFPLDGRFHHIVVNEGSSLPNEIGALPPGSLIPYRDGQLQPGTRAETSDEAWILPASAAASGVSALIEVVARLLGPGGCPWDRAQTHASLMKYLLEESYELFDAIDREDDEAMKEELGDVLLQVVLHAGIAQGRGAFDLEAVAQAEAEKLIRRHPHVFGDVHAPDADTVLRNWDQIKRAEHGDRSILSGVPKAMPALLRAMEVSKRAARAGFDWPDVESIWDKFNEEKSEFQEAASTSSEEAEFGDMLFALVNIARWRGVDPEQALQRMVDRFVTRFAVMERLAPGSLHALTADEWEELWQAAKNAERRGDGT